MASWRDQLYSYEQPGYNTSLYHHGIQGQKWGVRRYRNEDGTVTEEGKRHYSTATNTSNIARLANAKYFGTAKRVRDKQQMFKNKIAKSNDSNILLRNTVNDWRRGRIAQLETKAQHREAKNAWKKDKGNSEKLSDLRKKRANRVVKNGLLNYGELSMSTVMRGKYNRYRDAGDSVTKAALKTAGASPIAPQYGAIAAVAGAYSN